VAAALLSAPSACGVLSGLGASSRARVLALIPALIAATDIERNAAYVAAFEASRRSGGGGESESEEAGRREALMAMVLKVADVSNTAKAWPLARRWAELLKAEHLLLGASYEKEREQMCSETDFALSPLCFFSLFSFLFFPPFAQLSVRLTRA
jgi:hypothetical protein